MALKSNEDKNTQTNIEKPVKRKHKKTKAIIVMFVVLIVLILSAVFIPRLINIKIAQPASVTAYNVCAVSFGDVDTTISGSGTLTPVSEENLVTEDTVTVTAVNYEVGETVAEDAVIATAEDEYGNETKYTAPYECVLLELPIAADDKLEKGEQIAMIMGTDGFTMGIAVDELDIHQVKKGQAVTFTIDAVDGEYEGCVTAISYNGTQSGGTTAFQLTASLDYIAGVYPEMSASAEIVIESSGEGLLVPADAVYTSGDDSYVCLAPSDAVEGNEYSEDELDVSALTKVIVKTGMSDGSYILIESDELSEGSLVIRTEITSTQTGSVSANNNGFGGMDGFGGRGPGGMGEGGMNFGDFDFENFEPDNMPQGSGGYPGGMGGN